MSSILGVVSGKKNKTYITRGGVAYMFEVNKMKKRNKRMLLVGITALTMIAGTTLPAGAEVTSEAPERTEIRSTMTSYGVDQATQDQLIAKLEGGIVWDSLTEGAEPVAIVERDVADATERIETYADGSVVVTSLEKPTDVTGISGRALEWGCTFVSAGSNGGYYKNCDVTVNFVIITQGFMVDYENLKGSNMITDFWGYHHVIVGGALNNHRLERWSNTQVRYSADFSLAFQGFPVGHTSWMQANLQGNTISTTHN
jgi:hypothetical protein